MALYRYNAIALDGSRRTGRAEAADEGRLAAMLQAEKLFLTSSRAQGEQVAYTKLKTVEVADFCRQLGAMLSAGINLIRAMTILSQRDLSPGIQKIYTSIIGDLQRGSTLSEAMALREPSFPALLVNMIKAGEQTGRLDQSCMKMAEQYEKDHRLNQKIKAATMYPMILAWLIIGVILIIFTFVIPQFTGMFASMELPLATRIVMSTSTFLINYGLYLLIAIVALICLLTYAFHMPGPRRSLDRAKLKLPKIGRLLETIYTARFARTLASLYVSGIPMIQSLTIAQATIGNKYIEAQFREVIDHLGNGRTLSQAISIVDGFEKKLKSTIMIGEESGRLEQMLESIADQFDYDSEMASQRMVALMEPVLIIVMAGIVGVVIISVMLPIYQMYGVVDSGM